MRLLFISIPYVNFSLKLLNKKYSAIILIALMHAGIWADKVASLVTEAHACMLKPCTQTSGLLYQSSYNFVPMPLLVTLKDMLK